MRVLVSESSALVSSLMFSELLLRIFRKRVLVSVAVTGCVGQAKIC